MAPGFKLAHTPMETALFFTHNMYVMELRAELKCNTAVSSVMAIDTGFITDFQFVHVGNDRSKFTYTCSRIVRDD